MAFPFFVGILVKRIVLPEIVGAFAFAASIGLFFSMPCSILRNSVDRLVPKYRGFGDDSKATAVASVSLTLLAGYVLFACVLLALSGLCFHSDKWQSWAFPAYSVFWGVNSLTLFFFIYLKSLNLLKKSSLLLFGNITCFNITRYICVLFLGNRGHYVGYISGAVLSLIITACIVVRFISWDEAKPSLMSLRDLVHNQLVKDICHVGSLLVFYALLFQLLLAIDKYFVKFFQGNKMLAFYAFAAQGTTAVGLLLSSFVGSFAPKLYFGFASGNDNNPLLDRITYLVMILGYAGTFAIFTSAAFFVKRILPNYTSSIVFFKILALIILPFAQYNIGYVIAVGKDKIPPLIKRMTALLVIAIGLNWGLYTLLGVTGIAWATVVSVILAHLLVSSIVFRSYRLWYLSLLVLPVLAFNLYLTSYGMVVSVFMLMMVIAALLCPLVVRRQKSQT